MAIRKLDVERDQAGAFVLVVDEQDVVRQRSVQTGVQEGDMRVVTGGLTRPVKFCRATLWVCFNGLIK